MASIFCTSFGELPFDDLSLGNFGHSDPAVCLTDGGQAFGQAQRVCFPQAVGISTITSRIPFDLSVVLGYLEVTNV